MRDQEFKIVSNQRIARGVYQMDLSGDVSEIQRPGQFVNLKLGGLFLRRPISICDRGEGSLRLIYKAVGEGTERMSSMREGERLSLLIPLGNGFDTSFAGTSPLLVGGGVGVPPLYFLAKELMKEARECGIETKITVVLGFQSSEDVFYFDAFKALGCEVYLTTLDGSAGRQGLVTDILEELEYSYVYACGPEAMLKALCEKAGTSGQYSFEARMACGFGACMGCTKKTKSSYKRICKEGPVFLKEELLW